MPYIRVDPESYDEIAEELGRDELPPGTGPRPSGAFEYESAEARVDRKKLGGPAAAALDALLALGATRFRVRYDGGYDEGFAHPDTVWVGDGDARPAAAVARELAKPPAVALLRAAGKGLDSMHGNPGDLYGRVSDAQVGEYALDELAHELASKLLGDGFGTGEYQLYGAFTADLRTGQLVDHEDAQIPDEMR